MYFPAFGNSIFWARDRVGVGNSFEKPLKRAFRRGMGHVGYEAARKSYVAANMDRTESLGQFSWDFGALRDGKGCIHHTTHPTIPVTK